MNIAIVIIHNKGSQQNFSLIEVVKPFIVKNTSTYTDENNETFETYSYSLRTLNKPNIVRFYQIIPYGVTIPSNFNDIRSRNAIYGRKDEDKTGNHPIFSKWAENRATSDGAEIIIYLDDLNVLTKAIKELNK